MRPTWTLTGAALTFGGGDFHLDQTAFRWVDGVWETEVAVRRATARPTVWHQLTLRIAVDTVRRWRAAAINPFIEACAQLRDHLLRLRDPAAPSILTLL